jgi:hypothetical protein
MTQSAVPPLPQVELALTLAGTTFDLRWRALVGAVVTPPRFGGENEVLAAVRAAGQAGADLAVASLPPRLVGPAIRAGGVPIAARVSSLDAAEAAAEVGAALVLAPAELIEAAADAGVPVALLVDDIADLDLARSQVGDRPVPLAIDTSAMSTREEALAVESVAVPLGCRLLCTNDVRRTRRVAETVAALLAAQRGPADGP